MSTQSDRRKFLVDIHVHEACTADELWPDGNVPENPTEEDIRAAYRECVLYNLDIKDEEITCSVYTTEFGNLYNND